MTHRADKTLLLFNYDWDAAGFARLGRKIGQRFDSRGFDLFSFPSNANLVLFDLDRFVAKLAAQAQAQGWTAVSSQHEQFGALAAALLADKMGWPGTPPAAVVACQHKLHAREVLARVCPEANAPFQRLSAAYGEAAPAGLHFPRFVKPIKAAFSVLAKVVRSRDELHRFTRFGAYELWVIKRLVEPFERIAKRLLPHAGTAHSMMLEDPVHGAQYSLDGIVHNGQTKALGVVDSIMYPGTQAFMRFDYPSRLPQEVQARALDVANRFLREVGFSYGIFNMEFFYDPATEKLTVIEFNPRMASQFADLYLRVDGIDLYAMALVLAHGQDPWALARTAPSAGVASSLVYRVFDDHAGHLTQAIPPMPASGQVAALKAQFPDHLLLQFPKAGHSLARDFKWLGSYRYGILHLGGQDADDLRQRAAAASDILQWPLPYADTALHAGAHETSAATGHPLPVTSPTTPWRLST
ncbi:MAG: ATP-grasp domain-containing protein [Burkholderiaceae bacterium]